MYTREQIGELIVLHENPVSIDVELDGGGEGYHKIIIDVDRELVDIESLLVDGKVRFPNSDIFANRRRCGSSRALNCRLRRRNF